jgi:heat shock protein HtpX
MKRIVLFLITNLAVLVLLSVVARLLGLDVALARQGLDMGSLLSVAALIGFTGSFISLAMSKWTAKHLMGVQVIARPVAGMEAWLVDAVRTHAERSGVGMPEVGVFDAPEMNAFATGARRDHAPVAVSSGLLQGMTREDITAVLGHEMTHVANGDMVTRALIQGVVNTFVIFLSRALGTLLDSALAGPRATRTGTVLFRVRHCAADRARAARQYRGHVVLAAKGIPRGRRRCEAGGHGQHDWRA